MLSSATKLYASLLFIDTRHFCDRHYAVAIIGWRIIRYQSIIRLDRLHNNCGSPWQATSVGARQPIMPYLLIYSSLQTVRLKAEIDVDIEIYS